MEEEDEHELEHGRRKRKVTFMPSPGKSNCPLGISVSANAFFPDTTHTIFYRGHWLKVGTRSRKLP
jgi:chaperone BCS1